MSDMSKQHRYLGQPNTILVCLLIAQVAFTLILWIGQVRQQSIDSAAKLIRFDFGSVNAVTIEAASGSETHSTLSLKKDEHGWILSDYYGAPATTAAVNQVFVLLKALKKGFPVATTADAVERFKVGPTNFEHAITLIAPAKKKLTLYLGGSSGPKTIYARLSDSNDIFSIDLPEYVFSTKGADWFDRSIARLKPSDISKIDTGKFKIQEVAGKWTLTINGRDQVISKETAMPCINKLAFLSINSIIGTKKDVDFKTLTPVWSCDITAKNGKTVTYDFYKPKDKNYSVLKLSNKDYLFQVDDAEVKQLAEIPKQK